MGFKIIFGFDMCSLFHFVSHSSSWKAFKMNLWRADLLMNMFINVETKSSAHHVVLKRLNKVMLLDLYITHLIYILSYFLAFKLLLHMINLLNWNLFISFFVCVYTCVSFNLGTNCCKLGNSDKNVVSSFTYL